MSSLFGSKTVVSADVELNRFLLQNDMKMFEPGWPTSFKKIFGKNAISLHVGDAHKYMRSVIVSFLNSEKHRAVFLGDAEQLVSMALSTWKDKSVICVVDESRKFTFNMLLRNIMRMEPGEETDKLGREFEALMKGLMSIPLSLPGTSYWKALQARVKLLRVVNKKIEERNQKKRNGDALKDDDFLGWVMKNTDYSTEEMGDLMLTMLFGGYESTARAIPLALYFLGSCPDAVEQLKEEHIQIDRHKKKDGKLEWDDYKKMDFTQCVINEALRLGNIAKFIKRKATADVHFNGFTIPNQCSVTANFAAVHLDPSLYEEPELFNPWRWKITKSKNFMAFGGGARQCPGAELARLEMAVFLHYLALTWKWELEEPDHPLAMPYVHFPKGLPIRITK
ncbi:hypothetical protein J5N97_003849 [Dioscorea zingiberensis]|uniref:Cytochrome P450 n=1 Tax=Dioscorea zingiberensis TaxID=325984 RepID=A0A9D5D7C4_9LILI|nr:hypothetical protein J5N97_003849 [Dioscorea zingiberensis]